MAKIIENVYGSVLKEGKYILLNEGYNKMTLRLVASKCNIATGTIYNYFKSKDELVATIMLDDWKKLIENTSSKIKHSKCINEGLEIVFLMIKEYANIYQSIWIENNHSLITSNDKHALLINQIKNLIEPLNIDSDENTITFICEVLLNGAIRNDITYKNIRSYILKIIDVEDVYE